MSTRITINDVLDRILLKLSLVTPDNVSDTPIAFSREREDDGSYLWAAYIEVKTAWTEFDIRATSIYGAQQALAKAYTRFCQEVARA